jgi:hypothetical protein
MIDNAILRRDLYHLAAVFVDSREMNALASNEDLHRLPDLWNEFAMRLPSSAAGFALCQKTVVDNLFGREEPSVVVTTTA